MTIQTPVIAGNWKLNHGPEETRAFFRALLPEVPADHVGTIAIFPPSLSLAAAVEVIATRTDILAGVQDVYWESRGAFTGEISAPLAHEAGAQLALVGHSERRHVFGESIEETVKKVRAVLDAELSAILCVGETIEERESGAAQGVVTGQLEPVAGTLSQMELSRVLIAYEPVWAIGTGRTASPADAAEMHLHVREVLAKHFGSAASAIPILYGGSVKQENAPDLLAAPEVDGLLIGGASLEPSTFARICAIPS